MLLLLRFYLHLICHMIPQFYLYDCRAILTAWGVTTIVVGAFIFGQSTTLAVMEVFRKF